MPATPPKPSLVKSTALSMAQAVTNRLNALLPTVPSAYSPVTVYQPGTDGVGAQLSAPTSAFPAGTGYYGVWKAPDLNKGRPYTVQVECFGGGGGGGGGSSTSGGGGGGGGEYAAETAYPVKPGLSYAWVAGVPGTGGTANNDDNQGATAGGTGGTTVFDLAGTGIAGGVTANGGQGGDAGNTGNAGAGGTGSVNAARYSGGPGGANLPGTGGGSGGQGGTDNPFTLNQAGLLSVPPAAWYVLDDASSNGQLNDSSGNGLPAAAGGTGGNALAYGQPGAPVQVPGVTAAASPPGSPNPAAGGTQVQFPLNSLSQAAGYIRPPGAYAQGSTVTVSCWATPDPSGTWGNTAAGSRAVIAANCTGYVPGPVLPAAFPSRLSCSGTSLADANGYVLPSMTGINVNPTAVGSGPPVLSDFQAMAAKGAKYVRAELWWSHAQPASSPSLVSSWVTAVDNLVANCAASGLYVWLNLVFNGSTSMPSWAQAAGPEGSLQNYVANGQYFTQFVASRYGNPSSPQYNAACFGIGINEPVCDYVNTNGWVTNMVTEQLQMVSWVRAAGYAPEWVVSIAAGNAAGCAVLPNVTGSGQAAQTFTGMSTSPTTNFMLEVHDPVKAATTNTATTGFPDCDGRDATYGGVGPTVVQIDNGTYPGYPPVITGVTQADCQAMMTAWWAPYEAYAKAANCPIALMEGNWHPVTNSPGPGGAYGAAYIADKTALWYGLDPVPACLSFWEYGTNQAADEAAARPGISALGVNSDGWLYYADAFFAAGYTVAPSSAGMALYFQNNGTPANPSWSLNWYCGNGITSQTLSYPVAPVPGTPVYVAAVFSSGAMTLYVNGSAVASGTASMTELPVSGASLTAGISPALNRDWFFGCMANLWLAQGVLSAAGVAQAYGGSGGSSVSGGAGGGASGGPAANGGAGAGGSGSSGGGGGTPATQPAGAVGLTTPASAGVAGAASGSGNSGTTPPPGAGGGGAGESTSPPAVITVQVPFTAAATYCGTDAGAGAAGTVYNPVLQGTTGCLFGGGLPADSASGSKNSLLILPPGLAATLQDGSCTVTRVTLTVTNANPQAIQATLLEVGWAPDTSLPAAYGAADLAGSAGVVEIPAGAATVTADLTQSQLGLYLQNGTATALVLGPGASPSFDAYNAATGGDFYSVVYGPGAADKAGNSLAPYLTVTYAQSAAVQQGSSGGAGAILVTYLNQAQTLLGSWDNTDGIHATGGQLTEATIVLGAAVRDEVVLDGEVAPRPPARPGGRLGSTPGVPGTILGYSVGTVTTTQSAPGTYTFTVPAGVTSLSVACWGAGGGTTGGGAGQGQGGGGGGAYAAHPAYAVSPGQVITYVVGAGGAGRAAGTPVTTASYGGNTAFDITNVAGNGVVGCGGLSYLPQVNFAPGGANPFFVPAPPAVPVMFQGGNGGPLYTGQANGAGGGGSAGASGAGGGANYGGAPGTAGAGGGVPGGAGAASGSGASGPAPGGGGGGASAGPGSFAGGGGGNGKIVISYVSDTALHTSVAIASGTDEVGNSYPEGIMTDALTFNQNNPGFLNAFFGLLGGGQLLLEAAANVISGHTDNVAVEFNASDGTGSANGEIIYNDISRGAHFHAHWDSAGFTIAAGCINSVVPGTGTVASPAGVEGPHLATLINGWTGSGGGYNGLWYWVDPDVTASPGGSTSGQLHLAADISPPGGVPANSIIFVLPSGYRPQTTQNVGGVGWNNPQSSNSASLPWINVNTSGDVTIVGIEANAGMFFHVILPMGTF